MKKAAFLLVLILITSCGKPEPNLTVTGTIKGLKKGTLYLQQLQDTILVVMDSVIYNGEDNYSLKSDLEAPEILYLTLDKNAGDDIPRIAFFAVPGIIEINTTLKYFEFDAKITGSPLQEKLNEFKGITSRFNDQNLELIVAKFDAQKSGDSAQIEKANQDSDNLLKRKYLYAINFAMNNKNSEIAPYIALSEIYNANVKYLDTIYNALPKDIASSKYGIELEKFIKQRKEEESIQ
ncbi:MAG: hypothetical protein ACI83H_000568 [Glaciecola sp.]|jgi:hypothetical protein